ncbi:protein PIN-LIKES 3-like isoform X2 [Magnolia sinica]|uniref:protein PIN-LIKES 3-like isoform X2 n=1 Tax=Magnolia sinica TaxID=86752 RepID=UPI00265A79D4|nr:protein PIN-LIKES 3-like isoform X2 [Magnolia sinica]
MGLQDLFIAASVPVLKVLLVTAVGSFLATDRIDILGEDARKHLNNVVYFVFNPALVCTNLSRTITFKSVVSLWFMPLNILLTVVIGSALGRAIIQITKTPSHLRGLILGCCAAGNLGTMLLIIVPAICQEKGSPFGAPDVCRTYGLAYTSLSMAVCSSFKFLQVAHSTVKKIGAICLWSYVYNIIRISLSESTAEVENGFGTTSQGYIAKLLPENSTPEEFVGNVPISSHLKQLLNTISSSFDFRKLLAPSTIGVIVGFVIGVIPQIRRTLIGENAPLRVIQDSATLLSDGAIPSLTLIMGGNLMKGIHGSEIQVSLIAGIIVVRYIVLPLSGIVIVKGAVHFGLVHSDPLYQFILLLQFAVPPALNIGTITQLFGAGESECSIILLWSYALASVSLTLWSTFFMWLVS